MPNYPVPAKRYDPFITAFEKYVHERQKEISKVDRLMRPYEITRAALEKADILNEAKLSVEPGGVYVNIEVLEKDRREKFEAILAHIGDELCLAKLHPDGEPASLHNSTTFRYYWRLRGIAGKDQNPPEVEVRLNVPTKGTEFVRVTKEERVSNYTYPHYIAVWIEGTPEVQRKVTHDTQKDELSF